MSATNSILNTFIVWYQGLLSRCLRLPWRQNLPLPVRHHHIKLFLRHIFYSYGAEWIYTHLHHSILLFYQNLNIHHGMSSLDSRWNYKKVSTKFHLLQSYIFLLTLFILTWPFGWAVCHSCRMGYQSMAESRPKGPQLLLDHLRLGHLRVGELQPLSPMYSTRHFCLF